MLKRYPIYKCRVRNSRKSKVLKCLFCNHCDDLVMLSFYSVRSLHFSTRVNKYVLCVTCDKSGVLLCNIQREQVKWIFLVQTEM